MGRVVQNPLHKATVKIKIKNKRKKKGLARLVKAKIYCLEIFFLFANLSMYSLVFTPTSAVSPAQAVPNRL